MGRFQEKLLKAAAVQDESLGQLLDLRNQGFTTVVWQMSWNPCPICRTLHARSWDLSQFISGLVHSAPLFEHSHVGCRCVVLVQHPSGEEIEVAAF